MERMLPQERFVEKVKFLSPYRGTALSIKQLEQIMLDCNLKYRKDKNINDLRIAFGRGCENTYGSTVKMIQQTQNEIDKVLIIKNWELAVADSMEI